MNKQVQNSLSIESALEAVTRGEYAKEVKFKQSIDIALRVAVPKDATIRGSIQAPNGLDKKCIAAVFADTNNPDADYMVSEQEIQSFINSKKYKKCDVCIAEKRFVPILARLAAKKLGPRGLMPDMRTGTVSEDIAGTLKNFKNGVISFRGAKSGSKAQKKALKTEKLIIHAPIGSVEQPVSALTGNLQALLGEIKKSMPPKGRIIGASLSTTMGKSVRLKIEELA